MKNSIVLATAVASVLTSGIAAAELTANAAIASNYIWRGVTQTNDQAAGQGGIDWAHGSGLYVGTWVSNVDFSGLGDGYEMDVYAGFGGEVGGLGYDIGVISYQYPVSPEFNFTEVYVSGTMSVVTLGLAYTVDAAHGNDAEKDPTSSGQYESGDMYVNGSIDFTAGKSDVSIYAGSYMFDQDGKDYSATGGATVGEVDYNHFGASIGKDGFTFAVDKNDIKGASADNVRFTVSYSKDFEL
jgi:uncharacterized protein (TIGR02001 family)